MRTTASAAHTGGMRYPYADGAGRTAHTAATARRRYGLSTSAAGVSRQGGCVSRQRARWRTSYRSHVLASLSPRMRSSSWRSSSSSLSPSPTPVPSPPPPRSMLLTSPSLCTRRWSHMSSSSPFSPSLPPPPLPTDSGQQPVAWRMTTVTPPRQQAALTHLWGRLRRTHVWRRLRRTQASRRPAGGDRPAQWSGSGCGRAHCSLLSPALGEAVTHKGNGTPWLVGSGTRVRPGAPEPSCPDVLT